jgi:hypothetical protein
VADTVATLIVELAAKDSGVAARLKALDAQLKATATDARTTQTSLASLKGDGGAGMLRLAQARARLAVASGDGAGAERILQAALAGTDRTTVQTLGAQTQLVNIQNKMKGSAAGAAGGLSGLKSAAVGLGGAIGVLGVGLATVSAAADSFVKGFQLKAELDASRASIGVLLDGVRDVPATFASATAYANEFKLTQQEMTTALAASAGIMQQSKAPVEDILNVLQRLTVLNPQESIEGAAFAVRELAGGDIASIAERFNISRAAANAMKQEILAGGDAVVILDKYLTSVNVTTEALTASFDGPIGKMKDLAIAQEELALAQGEFATGPGLALLEAQLNLTRGTTRLFMADWQAMADGIAQNQGVIAGQDPLLAALGLGLGNIAASSAPAGAGIDAVTAAQGRLYDDTTISSAALNQLSNDMNMLSAAGGENAVAVAGLAAEYSAGAISATELYNQVAVLGDAHLNAAAAADTQAAAEAQTAAMINTSSLAAQGQAQALAEASQAAYEAANADMDLEAQARAAANALLASGNAGASAAAQLGNSTNPIDRLTAAYYRLAAAQQAAGQATGALGKGFGVTSAKDETTFVRAQIASRQARGGVKVEPTKTRAGGGGGGGGGASPAAKAADKAAKAETKANEKAEKEKEAHLQKLVELEAEYGQQQADIRADFAERMAEASRDFGDQQVDDRRGFYRSLLDIEDQGLRQQAAAQFEAAAQRAGELAQTEGADVAAAYEAEAAKVIAAQAKRQEEIRKLQEDGKRDEAQYLADLDAMDRAAEQRKLDRIASGEDSLQDQQAEALNDAQAAFAEKQGDVLGGAEAIGEAERARLTTLMAQTEQLRQQAALGGAGLGTGAAPSAAAGGGGAIPAPPTTGDAVAVADAANAAGLGAVVATLQEAVAQLAAIKAATDAGTGKVVGAVNGLKSGGAYLP